MSKQAPYLGLAAAVVAGGVAFAAYQGVRGEYAEVLDAAPILAREPVYGEVISSTAIKEVVAAPRDVCQDVTLEHRQPERDGTVGGTVAGAVIGGLIGNQVGSGSGRKAATVAGAVAGGFAGREIDRRHEGGRVTTSTQRQCETFSEAKERVVGYQVSFRHDDGRLGETRVDRKPGDRVLLGERERVVGYDVTYRYQDIERTVRMERDPGERLPVVDGAVVIATDAPGADG